MYLVRDIPAFVMYCVYGESHSSLLIESTDSMMDVCAGKNVLVFFGCSRGKKTGL